MNKQTLSLNVSGRIVINALRGFAKANEKVNVEIGRAFTLAYDEAVAANVPKTKDGIKVIGAALDKAILKNPEIVNLAEGAGYSMATLASYGSGLKRAYVAGVPWSPRAHLNAPEFPWKKKEAAAAETNTDDKPEAGKGGKAAKAAAAAPSEPVVASMDSLKLGLAQVIAMARQLGMADFAEKLYDVWLDSPIKPQPPKSK